MYKYLLFVNEVPPNKEFIEDLTNEFSLQLDFKNNRTTIMDNDKFLISIDRKIIRIQLFDESDYDSINKLKKYFYNTKEKP